MTRYVINPNGPEALVQEGLRVLPEIWEDGQRVPPQTGFYERWHFDARLEDESILLITFFDKPFFERRARLKPGVSVTILRPDGKKFLQVVQVEPKDYSSSSDHCYVRLGQSWVRGDANWNYEIDIQAEALTAHLFFTGLVAPWRPGTGKFISEDAGYFGWLAGIPFGKVEGTLSINGKMRPIKGSCYHDHRWGNTELSHVFSQWYIGRAHLGQYTLVFLEFTTAPTYGAEKISALLLTRDGQVLVSSTNPIGLEEQDFLPDEGGRSYPQGLTGCWTGSNGENVSLWLSEPLVVDSFSLVDFLPTWNRLVGGILSNPYHFNIVANLKLEAQVNGSLVSLEGPALYELALLR